MKVIILCGGNGIRLFGESSYIPKGMVKVGHRPILWHVMKRYSLFGVNDFVLALGYKGDMVRDYFLRYDQYIDDIEISLDGEQTLRRLTSHQESMWKITMSDTGDNSMTGARVARCKNYLDPQDENFMVSYADCLSDVDIKKVIKFHKRMGRIATIIGVRPPYREGELQVKKNVAIGLYENTKERVRSEEKWINGGYMIFNKKVFSYLTPFNECKMESDVFQRLIEDRELAVYPHLGFWRWLDADRDYVYLNELVEKNKLYWLQNNL